MKLSDYIFKYLEDIGVNTLFLLSGGGNMHLVDSAGKSNLTLVPMLHEQACGIAADAYAQYTSKLGVALVTTGPGATNIITAVAASWTDSVPVLVISGQVKTADISKGQRQRGIQEINIIDIVKPITKYAITITNPIFIKEHLEKALCYALNGRPGPVWIDIPLDMQSSDIDEDALELFPDYEINDTCLWPESAYDDTKRLINDAKRPIFLIGEGCRNNYDLLNRVIEKMNIPVLLTWRAMDLMEEGDPLYVGRPGMVGDRAANICQQKADLIICIGARVDLGQTAFDYANFGAKDAHKIIVDIDHNELNKFDGYLNTTCIEGDSHKFLNFLDSFSFEKKEWVWECQEIKKKYSVLKYENLIKEANENQQINPYYFIEVLSAFCTSDEIIIPCSSGRACEITLQAFRVKKGQRIFNNPAFGSMGFGLPAAIGACFASNKKRRVICIQGDGSIQMNLQELELLHRYNLPIKLFIWNNNGYASIRSTQKRFFNGHLVACDEQSGVTFPDILTLADAYCIWSLRIDNSKELSKRMSEIFSWNDGPLVCEVMINPDQEIMPKVQAGHKMDDMWPYNE